jgi:gliding motility-associated-like protein
MLAPDTYVVQAIDPNGCFDDTSITLSYPGLLEIDSTVFTQISCFGLNDGAIQNIQFVGGTGPFEFSVDGGPTQNYMFFSGLESGQHTVEVFDVNNCATSDYITIIEPTLLEVETTVSNWNNYQIRCSGDSLGYLNIICSGGTAPYLTDSSIFFNTFTIDSIWAGNYALVVEDANGCSYQETILFNEPSPIQHNFISTHINCATLNNGSVTDSVYGGVGSATTYSYLWDSGETNYSLSNLATGTYTITVTDENGCEDTESVTINDDNVFEATQGANFSVGCFDDCDGELNVNVSGGVPFSGLTSYNYLWNDFLGQTTESAIGLCVDSITLSTYYFCVVSDAVGCSDTVNFTLTQPEELQVDVSISKPISCNGLSDGILKANVTGGELAYNYTWSNGGTNPTINSLSLGIYKVIVEDANTCRDTFEVYLSEPTVLEISIQEFDISCFGDDDGYIEVLGSGGTSFEATYSYTLYSGAAVVDQVIDHESGSVSQTPFVFSNLPPGNYYVDAKDRNGCSVTSLSVEITEPFEPLSLLVDTVDETCLLNDGIIRIFPEGGSQSFNYFINGIPTLNNSNIIGGNQSGWYAITVVDTRGCEINDSTFIKDFRKIFLPDTLMNIDTTICLGQSIIVNVDERPELTYAWNDGIETGDRIIMPEVVLSYGQNATVTYTLTVTDANNSNCYHENIVVVNFNSIDPMLESDPEAEYGDYPIVLTGENINLFSDNNSCVEYTWQWGNDTITNANGSITINEISETDWYYLNVKDANGCLGYDSIYVVVGVKPYEAITPNGDDFNDAWTPLDIESYEQALVQVFNRWGGLVFESKGGNNYQEWDGTNNGKELAVGTYYYIIDLNTGDAPQTGPITIIR